MRASGTRYPAGQAQRGSVRAALTLTDTVAVVVVGVVLAGVFVIGAGGAAHVDKRAKCLSNLARIGYANLIYAAQDPAHIGIPHVRWTLS